MGKDALIVMLKRVVVQITIIAVSLVCFLILFLGLKNMDTELKNQLLSISTGILTGAVLSLIHVIVEKKIEDKLTKESEERFDNHFKDVIKKVDGTYLKLSSEIKCNCDNLANSVNDIQLPDNCVYCKFYIRSLRDRDGIDLKNLIEKSKKRIYFFATNLQSYVNLLTPIEKAVKRGIEVRLLVLKPTSLFVKLRYKEIGFNSSKDFFDEMRISLRNFSQLRDEIKKQNPSCKFFIKTHLHFPSCMIFIIDDKLIFNPILPYGKARTTCHIIYDMSQSDAKKMADIFLQTFTNCWENDAEDTQADYIFDEATLEMWRGRSSGQCST